MVIDRVTAGQKISGSPLTSATSLNQIIDSANAYQRNELGTPSADPADPVFNTDMVKVKNLTGDDRVRGDVVQLGDSLIDPINWRTLWFEGNTVADPVTSKIAILKFPIPNDRGDGNPGISWAQVSGVCTAQVNINDTSHKFAVAKSGEAYLDSAGSGPIQILSPVSSTGQQELAVLLGGVRSPLLGKADSNISKGSSGTVSIYTGAGGSETDSGANVTAYALGGAITSGKWVTVEYINGVPYVFCWEA